MVRNEVVFISFAVENNFSLEKNRLNIIYETLCFAYKEPLK